MFTYGPENAGSELIVNNGNPFVVPGQNVAVTIVDNGLNIDPTTSETWTFTTSTTARTTGATTDIDTSLGIYGFGDNGIWGVTDSDVAICAACNLRLFRQHQLTSSIETGLNTGVFEMHDAIGESVVDIKGDAGVDEVVTFSYGGNSASITVATNNCISITRCRCIIGLQVKQAVYTVTDPDMNKNASLVETLRRSG